MQIDRFNIVKPEKYTTKGGEEKTKWHQIGTITAFHKDDGSVGRIIEIPAIGLSGNIFPWKDREDRAVPGTSNPEEVGEAIGSDDEINVKDIPF